ncbi:hypothetical protein BDV25DRAFT_165354 [Aspergillus avenaceus]|uniref:Uncharacterized protein n=1 Tax=Aspergillus avenaceus TaxID=36643 RepID=A0A5N6TG98_ASPAV|nr:hypothetical protein BDV25DRAFT_165354 [Aspergillus avenaceus]
MSKSLLYELIEKKRSTMRDLTDEQALKLFKTSFPDEIEHLKGASATVESGDGLDVQTASMLLFDKQYIEVDRTLTSMLAIKWLLADDYKTFTSGQTNDILSEDSFRQLRECLSDKVCRKESLKALFAAMLIDDIGKDASLAEKLGESKDKNHSVIVLRAAEKGLIPALKTLPQDQQDIIIQSLEIGAKLDISQVVQAETAPNSLCALRTGKDLEQAFNMRAIITFLDVAGAAAHRNPKGGAVMTESVFQHYKKAMDIMDQYRTGKIEDSQQCYDRYLSYRADVLAQRNFPLLNPADQTDRALLRLLCMGRVEHKKPAEQFQAAFESLPPDKKSQLINGLSVNGVTDGIAILPYYAPGILAEARRNLPDEDETSIINAIKAFMELLARVFEGSEPHPNMPGGIKERDLSASHIQEVVKGAAFRKDPSVLANIELKWD